MVDTGDLKSPAYGVPVRVRSRVPDIKELHMPMYETTVRTPQGEVKDRVYAGTPQEAKQLFEQRHGPRNVPYIPKIIPS